MSLLVASTLCDEGEYGFRHCVVASTWAFEAQGPGSIPGGGAMYMPAKVQKTVWWIGGAR
jgi:hypothetical protein